jgi:hypothetical protein
MAEIMAAKQNPDDKFPRAYSEWADGGWVSFLQVCRPQHPQSSLTTPYILHHSNNLPRP